MPESQTVQLDVASSRVSDPAFFIETGSLEPPVVTLAHNQDYPSVKDFYARQHTFKQDRTPDKQGVEVHIRFDGEPTGHGLFSINLAQPNMTGDFTVIPTRH